jgi:hypothetical protein
MGPLNYGASFSCTEEAVRASVYVEIIPSGLL